MYSRESENGINLNQSNPCLPEMPRYSLQAIGTIESVFREKFGTPRQVWDKCANKWPWCPTRRNSLFNSRLCLPVYMTGEACPYIARTATPRAGEQWAHGIRRAPGVHPRLDRLHV